MSKRKKKNGAIIILTFQNKRFNDRMGRKPILEELKKKRSSEVLGRSVEKKNSSAEKGLHREVPVMRGYA